MAQSKRRFTLATLAAATLLAAAYLAGCGPEASAVGTADRTFTVSGPVRLELENGSGDSRVTVGAPGEVRVHAEFRVHAWPWDDPDRTLKNLVANPPFSQEDSLIRIGHSGWDMNMVSADYSVTVPPDTQMKSMAGSGNLDVNGIAGPANFTVGSGNISATAIANDTHAVVGSGNVTLTDTKGRVDVTSGSGDLVVRGAKDEVRARAGSGDIRIEQPAGNVVAEAEAATSNCGARQRTSACTPVRAKSTWKAIRLRRASGTSAPVPAMWSCTFPRAPVSGFTPAAARATSTSRLLRRASNPRESTIFRRASATAKLASRSKPPPAPFPCISVNGSRIAAAPPDSRDRMKFRCAQSASPCAPAFF